MSASLRCALAATLLIGSVACSNSSSSSTPSGPNPSSTTITVEAYNGGRLGGYQVTLSTGLGADGPTGIITSERTNGVGQVIFYNLPSNGQLCVYTSVTIGARLYAVNHCAQPFPSKYTLKFGPHGP
jgi:hypothetical protein